MRVDPPSTIYRDQLSSLFHGLALWDPNRPNGPGGYAKVSIGDVGYLHEGMFIRMFNVTLPWNDPSNILLITPEPYDLLDCHPFDNVVSAPFERVDHYSRFVTAEKNTGNFQAMIPDDLEGVTYKFRNSGALLSLPNGGHREDIIRPKVFQDYIRDHVDTWFKWAKKDRLGVERMEDFILVSGCTLVTSWAAAAGYADNTSEAGISLTSKILSNSGASFVWDNVRGQVSYHNSRFDPQNPPTMADQCVFIRGFRARRILFWTRSLRAAAEPRPDDPENRREDEIQVSRVAGAPRYRDPLGGVLGYIAEKCQTDNVEEGILAIAHHDDLQFVEDMETLSADAIEEFLQGKQMPLLVENGVAILNDSADDKPLLSGVTEGVFTAAAESDGEQVPLVIHPVLTNYNTKLEMNDSPDRDHPKEDMNSPAPMLSLKSESHQGHPQTITTEVSSDTRGVGVTVQEVLRSIHEGLKMPFPRRELRKLGAEERTMINAAFGESEEELNKRPRRIDRDRLQISQQFGPDGSGLIHTSTLPTPIHL